MNYCYVYNDTKRFFTLLCNPSDLRRGFHWVWMPLWCYKSVGKLWDNSYPVICDMLPSLSKDRLCSNCVLGTKIKFVTLCLTIRWHSLRIRFRKNSAAKPLSLSGLDHSTLKSRIWLALKNSESNHIYYSARMGRLSLDFLGEYFWAAGAMRRKSQQVGEEVCGRGLWACDWGKQDPCPICSLVILVALIFFKLLLGLIYMYQDPNPKEFFKNRN